MAWYRDLFGADYLELWKEVGDEERIRKETELICTLLELEPPAHLLDVPCGWGRLSMPLVRRGYQVTGVDLNPPQLERARQLVAEQGVEMTLVEADMRALPFGDGTFDGLINFFTSFGYFSHDENLAVLREFHRVLRPGGRFLIEVHNRDFLVANFQANRIDRLSDGAFVLRERTFDPTRDVTDEKVTWLRDPPREYEVRLYNYSAGELSRMLETAGFVSQRAVSTANAEIGPFGAVPQRFAIVAQRDGI